MAEKKKKKQKIKGMPSTSIQSRMPSKTSRGKAGKVSKPKKKYGTGIVGQLAKRRAKRKAEGKWVLGEKLTKAGRKRASGRKAGKKAAKSVPKGTNVGIGVVGEKSKKAKKVRGLTSKSRAKKLGVAKGTKVRKGAVGAKKTKGGAYVKYEKKSKAAKSFRSTFKSKCAGGAKSFSWDGRSYSCSKASPSKKKGGGGGRDIGGVKQGMTSD
jgi:hypothetical protein